MEDWQCRECGKSFGSRKGFHQHLKAHFLSLGEYYVKYFDRRDQFTNERIPFKNYEQYFQHDFVSFNNYLNWIKSQPCSTAKEYIINQLKEKVSHKELRFMPPNLFYDLYGIANRFTTECLWEDYHTFCADIGLPIWFNQTLPKDFWTSTPEDMRILIDTREQLPINFNNSLSQKLDFGDYTAAGDFFSKTFVDRKSQDDFRSTFGKDVDRFRREMNRCVQFDSYMFVVVESSIDKIEEDNQTNKFKSNLTFLWHNVRDLIAAYPQNLQFIFAHNRAGAKKIIPKILCHGNKLWRVDLQYHIDQRIYGTQHIYNLS